MFDKKLKEFATENQWKIMQAWATYGSTKKAAEHLGISPSTVRGAASRVTKKAAKQGFAPGSDMTKMAPEGFEVAGTSTMYDSDGDVKLQWVKTTQGKEAREAKLIDLLEAIAEPYKNKSTKVLAPPSIDSGLINIIPFGDPHVGLYCWNAEVNNSFDTEIAEDIMIKAVDYLVTSAPKAETALIVNLGDFFHADTSAGITLRSGNKLDVDGKWDQILEIGIRIMRRCIETALATHEKVVVMNAVGNHDDHSSKILSIVMREYFRNNDRVTIMPATQAFQYYQFGKNMFGVTHGHTIKPLDLEGIMARDCNDTWSETTRRKWFVGHYHSQKVHEMRNCSVEYYRTLAPGDSWSVASGYRSYRDMRCETWHKDVGHVGTTIFDPVMVAQ